MEFNDDDRGCNNCVCFVIKRIENNFQFISRKIEII